MKVGTGKEEEMICNFKAIPPSFLSAPSLSYDTNFVRVMSLKIPSFNFNWKAAVCRDRL